MISGFPAGQPPLNDTSYSSPKLAAQSDTPIPAVSTADVDAIVQISPQAQQLAQLDAAAATLHNQKEWKQQKKPKTLLDYIEEAEVRGRGPRAEEAERRRQQLGNWMPMIASGDETGMSINALAANLSAAAASDAADTGAAALPLPTLYVTSGKRGETIAGAGLGKDLKTQLLSVMNDIVAGSGFIKRQLEMLQVGPRQHRRRHKPVDAAQFDAAQVDARFRDHNGNPDLSKMLGAVLGEQIKDKSSG